MASPDCSGPDGTCQCVASPLLDLLGSKYAMDVLCVVASHEPVRFSTIEDHVSDASTSTLSTRLDELAAAGLLERERFDEIPPRVEYRLSEDGTELSQRLRPLFDWLAERDGEGSQHTTRGTPDGRGRSRGRSPGERDAWEREAGETEARETEAGETETGNDRPGHGPR